MKNVFLTEGNWVSKIPRKHIDMRNDSAWMYIFDAIHLPITNFNEVVGYDNVFVMFPKGFLSLNMVGLKVSEKPNQFSELLSINIIKELKKVNKNVHYIQEGPTWVFNDYTVTDQFNFYNMLAEADTIFAHNEYDKKFYNGLFPGINLDTLPPVMIEDSLKDIQPIAEDKVMIGGNFARWYGGFQSYIVADIFAAEKYIQESHAKQTDEILIRDITHLPRLNWLNWMQTLSKFKYAVHLMPTPAAGTFSMNCAYFGIPCIGNEKVDTQNICHPELSVDVYDIEKARELAIRLRDDKEFYEKCSRQSKENYQKYYSEEVWKEKIFNVIS